MQNFNGIFKCLQWKIKLRKQIIELYVKYYFQLCKYVCYITDGDLTRRLIFKAFVLNICMKYLTLSLGRLFLAPVWSLEIMQCKARMNM